MKPKASKFKNIEQKVANLEQARESLVAKRDNLEQHIKLNPRDKQAFKAMLYSQRAEVMVKRELALNEYLQRAKPYL